MNYQLITTLAELDALKPVWKALESQTQLPMQQFVWARECAASLPPDQTLAIVVIQDGTQTVGIAPFQQDAHKPVLRWLGADMSYEPSAPILRNTYSVQDLANALGSLGMTFYTYRLAENAFSLKPFESTFWKRGVLIVRPERGWPWIEFNSQWSTPEDLLNSGRRSDLRRSRRIAEQWGPLSLEHHCPTRESLAPILEDAIALESRSWKSQAGTALAVDPVRGSFFRRYASAVCEQRRLHFYFLRLGTQRVAMQMGIEAHRRLWLLKIGYDDQFARCSPGMLLLREVLNDMRGRDYLSLEFLGTVEPWLRVWTSLERSCISLRGYPFKVGAVTSLAKDVIHSAWNRLHPPTPRIAIKTS
jgi:CelD/BcsL family acetyltransferase involved in cellulose biosynthesis